MGLDSAAVWGSDCPRRPSGRVCRRGQQLAQRDTGGEIVSALLLFAAAVGVSGTFGMGLPGHTDIVGGFGRVLRGLSAPADLMEALVAQAEVVADLVEDRLADLLAEPGGGEPHAEVGLAVDGDLVRHGCEVVLATVGQHHALVEAEEIAVLSDLVGARALLDDDMQVVDTIDNPLRELGEHLVDNLFKLDQVHG